MSAALITPTSDLSVVNGNADVHLIEINKVTQNDWIELDYPALWFTVTDETGVTEAATYCLGVVNDGSNITATATTITFDGATVAQWPATGTSFYIKINDEIMEVSSYSATVLTVRRGAMGTTASTHTDNDIFYVLNSILLVSAAVTKCHALVVTKGIEH